MGFIIYNCQFYFETVYLKTIGHKFLLLLLYKLCVGFKQEICGYCLFFARPDSHGIKFRDLALNGEIHGTKYLQNLEFWILVNKDLHYHGKSCKNLTKN